MNKLLQITYPLYILLLPIFFVLHSWNSFYYLVLLKDTLWILVEILLLLLFFFCLCLILYRNVQKAGIFSFLLSAFMLFYGYIYDQFQHLPKVLSRHSILLTLLIFFSAAAFVILKKRSAIQLQKINRYLNALLFTLCIYEITNTTIILCGMNKKYNLVNTKSTTDQSKYPNIYILVFDEYASSKSLKRDYGYDNSNLDSFLLNKSFYLMKDSKSNYLRTNLSIASLLNYDYTNGLKPRNGMTAEDLLRNHKQIKYNALFTLGRKYGYEIYNYTIFDTELSPSKVKNDYLFNNERIIISNTMISRLINDLGPNLNFSFLKKILNTEITAETYRRYNDRAMQVLLSDLKSKKSKSPKLAYAHFLMPHPPFLYDSSSKPVYFDDQKLENYYDKKFVPNYLNYLPYTNNHLKTIVSAVLSENNNNCIIFLLGDHGYKIMNDSTLPTDHFFNNLQSVYLPKKNYYPLKQNSTPVNVMRHIINTAFNYHLPYLIDSSVLIGNKW